MAVELEHPGCDPCIAAPRSFIEYSASRVGQAWTEEDHAALLRHLAQVDELCIEIWKRLHTSGNSQARYEEASRSLQCLSRES